MTIHGVPGGSTDWQPAVSDTSDAAARDAAERDAAASPSTPRAPRSASGLTRADVLARLQAARGSGWSLLRFSDLTRNVLTRAREAGADGRVTASEVEDLVREAKDFDTITGGERQVLLDVLAGEFGTLDPEAGGGLADFLGVAWSGDESASTTTETGAATSTTATETTAHVQEAALVPLLARHASLADVLAGSATLEPGARGTAVGDLQRALTAVGFPTGVDGAYGGQTARSVRQLQRSVGVAETGNVDAATLRALNVKLSALPASAQQPVSLVAESVGPAGKNHTWDVKALQRRLKDLGFYRGPVDGRYRSSLGLALQVFGGATRDATNVARRGRARVAERTLQPGEADDRWLLSDRAPKWTEIPASGTGWENGDRDNFSYGTTWLLESLQRAGARYAAGQKEGWVSIRTNDASRLRGGNTTDHATHETGLDLDLMVGGGGVSWRSRGYDQDETWAKITAFLDDEGVSTVFFNDPVLIARANRDPKYEGRVMRIRGHDNHFHVNIKPPTLRP